MGDGVPNPATAQKGETAPSDGLRNWAGARSSNASVELDVPARVQTLRTRATCFASRLLDGDPFQDTSVCLAA